MFRKSMPDHPQLRNRYIQVAAAIMVVTIGLIWRSGWLPLSPFMSKYGGSALWALMVFAGLGWIFTRISTAKLALIALLFAWSIEFLQLWHPPWLDAIRAYRLGHHVLGTTFNWPDLPAYAIGIAIGAWIETAWRRANR